MERGARYNRGLSKQVMISVSHYQSPCNEKEIGIEKACHEFKVCYFFKNTIWTKNKTEDPSVLYAGKGYIRNPKELCES